jgi:hypothetical protein
MPVEKFDVSVVMARLQSNNRWVAVRWEARGIIPGETPGGSRRILVDSTHERQILFGGHVIELRRDEAQGYYLNVTSPGPSAFVMWRMRNEEAVPVLVTASYDEAARWLDAGEQVDPVPLPAEYVRIIAQFAAEHYKPEIKSGRRRGRVPSADAR